MNISIDKIQNWFVNQSNWLPTLRWLSWITALYFLAKVVWIWVLYFTPSNPVDVKSMISVPKTTTGPSQSSQSMDVTALLKQSIFGSIQAAPKLEVIEVEAPETQLNLKLSGIYAADVPDKANAIIELNGGRQEVYFINDKLNVSGQVYLRQVYSDRVILESNGRNETLKLEDNNVISVNADIDSALNMRVDDKRNDNRVSRQLTHYREQILSNPSSLSDVIMPQPYTENGELKGFRVSPGRDKRLFRDVGLQNGDIITSINGVKLNNMQEAMMLMQQAQSIQELSVELERDGQPLSLLLNFNSKAGL
ncbi:MAG: type II secretion system protein GspC [Gammaproteobacteria bacterium]|nr:type II secretion system protein GspC [Gammaproteobacteria bacterium]